MTHFDFSHVRTWIFDLDNTLYPPKVALFDQISEKMTVFLMEFLEVDQAKANELRGEYWSKHGTTLAGLMDLHGMPPEKFLVDVHDIDFSVLPPATALVGLIDALPGRKIVYTNGTEPYARNVLHARGLEQCFDAVYGVEHADYRPKPERAAFESVFDLARVDRKSAAMFEDEMRNLEVPKAMGLGTIYISPNATAAPYVDLHESKLETALEQIIAGGFDDATNPYL